MATEKDSRTYIRIHDGMPDHPKVDGLSDAAFRLLVTMWCWCSRHLTDGRVPGATWLKRGTLKARGELVAAGLADLTEDGSVLMHHYTDHQRTAEEVRAISEARREAGKLGGKAKAKALANAKANGLANGKQNLPIDIGIDISKERTSEVADAPSDDSDDEPHRDEPREDVERVCKHLVDVMVANGCKRPAITNRWRDEARRMIDRDGREVERIIRAIDWCWADGFWRGKVESVPKLRAQYDKLRLDAARGGRSNVTALDFGEKPTEPKPPSDDMRQRWKS